MPVRVRDAYTECDRGNVNAKDISSIRDLRVRAALKLEPVGAVRHGTVG